MLYIYLNTSMKTDFLAGDLQAVFLLWKNLAELLSLSDHAARKSGTRGEIREGVFSDGITGCLGHLAAQTSGVKNPVSTGFFTLPAPG